MSWPARIAVEQVAHVLQGVPGGFAISSMWSLMSLPATDCALSAPSATYITASYDSAAYCAGWWPYAALNFTLNAVVLPEAGFVPVTPAASHLPSAQGGEPEEQPAFVARSLSCGAPTALNRP